MTLETGPHPLTTVILSLMVTALIVNHVVGIMALLLAWQAIHKVDDLRADHVKLWGRVYTEKATSQAITTSLVGGAMASSQGGAASADRSAAIGEGVRGDVSNSTPFHP